MKTKLLYAALLLTNIMAFSQTTVAIPDSAFEAYLEAEFTANITPDGSTTDGSITFNDINAVQDIDFNTPNIASPTASVVNLSGIMEFSNLKYLIARNNDITGDVDLSGLSSLKKVYIDGNPNLTALNLSGCSSLEQVKASKCNLSSLDLSTTILNTSNIASLTDVDVDTNNLNSLNISGHSDIDYLDIYGNATLTNIDISLLTKLTFLRFQNCDITGDIDVSANVLLATLGAYNNNNLINIDLGAIPYTSFSYFKIASNANLTCVYTDNASDFAPGGPLETAIGSNYSVGINTNFVLDATACATLGTEDFNAFEFSMYPNPTKENITISLNDDASYQLINMNGQTLMKGYFNAGNNPLSISNLASGLYFINMTTTNGNRMTHKLVKQ